MPKYYLPCPSIRSTQGFGGNPATYAPLKGHPAYDFSFTWNEPVPFIADSYVYAKLNENNSNPDKYTGLCTLVFHEDGVDEIIYGHGNSMPPQIGKTYFLGETAIFAGNKGFVQYNGRTITKAEKLVGSTLGTHLHLQRRPVKQVTKITKGKKYLETPKGKLKYKGFYYEILNYDNGYNGCEPIKFNGKVAKDDGISYEEALTNLEKAGLPGWILAMAKVVLKSKFGR